MVATFRVSGGHALKGTVHPAGNKNAALPILAATLLADGPCRIERVPRIRDVETMLGLLETLGAAVRWTGPNALEVDTAQASPHALDPELAARMRASILLAGPLLFRCGRCSSHRPAATSSGAAAWIRISWRSSNSGRQPQSTAAFTSAPRACAAADIFWTSPA